MASGIVGRPSLQSCEYVTVEEVLKMREEWKADEGAPLPGVALLATIVEYDPHTNVCELERDGARVTVDTSLLGGPPGVAGDMVVVLGTLLPPVKARRVVGDGCAVQVTLAREAPWMHAALHQRAVKVLREFVSKDLANGAALPPRR